MRCFLSITCLLLGIAIGAAGGVCYGEMAVYKQQFAYQSGLMTAMAEDVHPDHPARKR